jgi:hypothetical protein
LTKPRREILDDVAAARPCSPTFAQVAEIAEGFVDRPVVDRTGVTSRYSFTFTIPGQTLVEVMVPSASEPGRGIPLLSALLQEQLGLRLKSARGAVDVVRIETIDRPGENQLRGPAPRRAQRAVDRSLRACQAEKAMPKPAAATATQAEGSDEAMIIRPAAVTTIPTIAQPAYSRMRGSSRSE